MYWVSVKDQLPDEDMRVLTYDARRDDFIRNYIVYLPEPMWACTKTTEQDHITHWMLVNKPDEHH